jgi:hypothetical protein
VKPREREREAARRKHVIGRGVDWAAVAHRIHGLVRVHDGSDVPGETARIALEERVLRERLQREPLDVAIRLLTSVVRLYGLDPTWVLTGVFDTATHRTALEGSAEETTLLVERLIVDMSAAHSTAV